MSKAAFQHPLVSALRFASIVVPVLLSCLAFAPPGVCQTRQICPWLNEATAGGFLNASVTTSVTHPNKGTDDANCEFTYHEGATVKVLRIEVATLNGSPATAFAPYLAQCGANGTPLKAIGNEAVVCSFDAKNKLLSEQVVGRVRDHAFIVRISSNAASMDSDVRRTKAEKVAEQVAGFLF